MVAPLGRGIKIVTPFVVPVAYCLLKERSGRDWTRGCIALDDQDMQDLYEAVQLRTPVEILP